MKMQLQIKYKERDYLQIYDRLQKLVIYLVKNDCLDEARHLLKTMDLLEEKQQ